MFASNHVVLTTAVAPTEFVQLLVSGQAVALQVLSTKVPFQGAQELPPTAHCLEQDAV